jgi:hypothetical protein
VTEQPGSDPERSSAFHFLGCGQRNPSGTAANELHNEFECMAASLPAQTILGIALHKDGSVHVHYIAVLPTWLWLMMRERQGVQSDPICDSCLISRNGGLGFARLFRSLRAGIAVALSRVTRSQRKSPSEGSRELAGRGESSRQCDLKHRQRGFAQQLS